MASLYADEQRSVKIRGSVAVIDQWRKQQRARHASFCMEQADVRRRRKIYGVSVIKAGESGGSCVRRERQMSSNLGHSFLAVEQNVSPAAPNPADSARLYFRVMFWGRNCPRCRRRGAIRDCENRTVPPRPGVASFRRCWQFLALPYCCQNSSAKPNESVIPAPPVAVKIVQ